MSTVRVANSAALYFDGAKEQSIPLRWFERVRTFFGQYHLSPVLFTADGGDFRLDDAYLLEEALEEAVPWAKELASRGNDLVESLRSGVIGKLRLDSPTATAKNRQDWRADVSVVCATGKCYVGIDDRLICESSVLLRLAYDMVKGLFPVRYGISYKMPIAQCPDAYASGFVRSTFADVREKIRNRPDWEFRRENRHQLWCDELRGAKRHLSALFRGAYPASIITESHLRAGALRSRGLGRFTELDNSLWLWELSDSEMDSAEQILESRGVLIGAPADSPHT